MLDTIKGLGAQGNSKSAVLKALFATKNRQSVLGTYGFDANGDTTLKSYGLYKVGSDGNVKFFKTLTPTAIASLADVWRERRPAFPPHRIRHTGHTCGPPWKPVRLLRGCPAVAGRPVAALRKFLGKWGLIIALAGAARCISPSTT